MEFCTVVSCMDGRIQLPVNEFMCQRFNAEYVDTITEAGPNRILAEGREGALLDSVFDRIAISIDLHGSRAIGIVAHYDCAGSPGDETIQRTLLKRALQLLQERITGVEIVGLWVDENWHVFEVSQKSTGA